MPGQFTKEAVANEVLRGEEVGFQERAERGERGIESNRQREGVPKGRGSEGEGTTGKGGG